MDDEEITSDPVRDTARAAPGRARTQARARAGFFLLLAAALSGCVSLPQSEALRAAAAADLAERVELTGVPFHTQDDFLCGPASLAMVINAAGVPATVEGLTPLVYLPERRGSLQAEMLGATRRQGLVAYVLPPNLEDVLREVAAGTPVVALLNFGIRIFPLWHYAVVVGYDLGKREVVLRTGSTPRRLVPLGFFEYLWRDSGHWALVALPPGKLPASGREAEFAAAVAALERTGRHAEARSSYRALVARWPTSLIGLVGLGNVEYALGDRAAAERVFRRATEADPSSGAALNNLAHALAVLGRVDEAEAAARRALSLGGPAAEQAQKTLDEILALKLRHP